MANPTVQEAASTMSVEDVKEALTGLGFDLVRDDESGLTFVYAGNNEVKIVKAAGSSEVSSVVGRKILDEALKIVDQNFPSLNISRLSI